jgi:hypothetical protein
MFEKAGSELVRLKELREGLSQATDNRNFPRRFVFGSEELTVDELVGQSPRMCGGRSPKRRAWTCA